MRIRIQTIPPLPDLKAWFVPRPTGAILAVKTISELKKVLCHDITPLSQGGHSYKTIRLLLEGFELLDGLPYEEVLRDGDLVFVQVSHEVLVKSGDARKRKRRHSLDGILTKRRRKNNNKSAGCDVAVKTSTSSDSSSVMESASSSESDDESNNSDSGSSTTSNNESSGESSDGSTASSSTSRNDSRRLSLPPKPIPRPKVPATFSVPPGLGKPSTHSRNRRRRLKRQHARDAKENQNAPPQGISDANLTPLGSTVSEKPKGIIPGDGAEPRTNTSTELSKIQSASFESRDDSNPLALDNPNGDIMMMSLRNKNKKKNFRQTMVAPAVRKIVFDSNGNAQGVTVPTAASSVVSPQAERTETVQEDQTAYTPTSLPSQVLPPSELAAAGLLPPNMFVTSVEFGKQPKKKRKKQNLRDTHEEELVSHELQVPQPYEDEDESRFDDDNIHLSYGDEEESGNNNDVGEPQFDWGRVESNWERFSPVKSLDQLRSGVLVCWQCLAINPRTFTPENMLSVGRVEKVTTETVTILQLSRPGTEIAAAFGIGEEDGGDGAEEEHSLEDVFGLGWRVVELP